MMKLIQLKLKWFAKLILARYKPEIIGITGSVGKTGTKEAVYAVLKDKYKVRRSVKNYNNELGLPLTIIDAEAQGRNMFGWAGVFLKAAYVLFSNRKFPKILILEMGVDKPGDMDYLTDIARPEIAVMTMVGTVHAESFPNRDSIRKEKAKLLQAVPEDGWAIVNYDNEPCRLSVKGLKAKVITYGLDEGAMLRADKIDYNFLSAKTADDLRGLRFRLHFRGQEQTVALPRVLGTAAVYSALAAAAVGIAKGITLQDIALSLEAYSPPKGRMCLISGVKKTTLIDDAYNAEPESTRMALGVLRQIPVAPEAKKYAVLGDMLELGEYSAGLHRDIGKYAVKCGIDYLVLVGERSLDIAHGAREAGMAEDRIYHFPFSPEAGRFLQERIREDDLLLIKGSQGMRMEKIVKELMADPLRAEELLVRQDRQWTGK